MIIFMMCLYGQKVTDNLNKSYRLSMLLYLEVEQTAQIFAFSHSWCQSPTRVNVKKFLSMIFQ